MALSELLNPQSEQEEREFLGHLHKPLHTSSASYTATATAAANNNHEGFEQVLLLLRGQQQHARAARSSSTELLSSLASTSGATTQTGLPSERDASSAPLANSDCEGGDDEISTSMDFEEDEDEEDETENEGSPTPSRLNARGSLYQQKTDRIALKVRRFLAGNPDMSKELPAPAVVEAEVHSALSTLPEIKVMKKTVNQTTATVAYFVLRKLHVTSFSLLEVIQLLKAGEKSHSLSRSTKPNHSRNHADVLGISKLLTSLEHKSSQVEEPHAKTCLEATQRLAQSLGCPANVERLACDFAMLSETSSLASRHSASVAASCVFLAAKKLSHRLTLTKVSEASKVSACTIRKAFRALEPLTANK